MRRRALIGSSLCLAAPPVRARGVIEIATAEQHPYAIAQGPEPGVVLTVSAELFRMIGLQVVFRFLPWAEAAARAARTEGVAIAPITRTPAREAQFLWAVPLFDDPSGFATLRGRPPDSLAEARDLAMIAVLTGSPHHAYLATRGFTNLLPIPGRAEALAALRARDVSAWFCGLPKMRAHLGRLAQFGRPIFSEAAWLALHPATRDVPVVELRQAHAKLEMDGSLDHMLRPYLGPGA